MSVESEIGNLLRALAPEEYEMHPAVVKSVEGKSCTVERVDDGRELRNVTLSLSKSEKEGLVITPVAGSQVLVTSANRRSWFVSQYSAIEKVTLNAAEKIELNGGDGGKNGGLVKVAALTDKLNALEQQVNKILMQLKATIIPVAPSATYLLSVDFADIQPLQTTAKEDIENENITH